LQLETFKLQNQLNLQLIYWMQDEHLC
jgi:hypothetical protein